MKTYFRLTSKTRSLRPPKLKRAKIRVDKKLASSGPGAEASYSKWMKTLSKVAQTRKNGRNRHFKVGDIVENMNPCFSYQEKAGTVKCAVYGQCTLQARQFGIIQRINGMYIYVKPVIKGKKCNLWTDECYESELRHVDKRLNIFKTVTRLFKHRWRGDHVGSSNYPMI